MKYKLICIILIFFSSNIIIKACDCYYGGPFIKMAKGSELVVLVKVSRYITIANWGTQVPMSMEVDVIKIYEGTEKRQKLVIWGDDGHLCRPYISTFKLGNYYILALSSGTPLYAHEKELATDYAISICGAFWLDVDIIKGKVIGDFDSTNRAVQIISLDQLCSRLKSNGH